MCNVKLPLIVLLKKNFIVGYFLNLRQLQMYMLGLEEAEMCYR